MEAERLNAVVGFYLRVYCNWHQDDWLDLLAHCKLLSTIGPPAALEYRFSFSAMDTTWSPSSSP